MKKKRLLLKTTLIATLAIMLSGTKLIALIFTAFLLCLPAVLGEEFHQFDRIFYRTSTFYDTARRFLCPLFDANSVADYWFRYRYYSKEYVMDVPFILDSYRELFLYDIDMILAAIIATVLVMVVYKHRRAEHVGKTIIYKPVRWAVKIIICIVTSLAGVVALNTVCHSIQSQYLYVIFGFAMLIICLITGGFVEICLDLDIKSFSKGRRQTLMAMAILLLIFFIYRGDLLGYDSYVPTPSYEKMSVLNGKVNLAFATGGFDFADDGSVKQLNYNAAVALCDEYGGTPERDPGSSAMYFSYTDEVNTEHQVWYADQETLKVWIETAKNSGCEKISIWRLGGNL